MINLEKTFDVAAVEKLLVDLWAQTNADLEDDDTAILRARVANLMVFVSNDAALREAAESMQALTAAHPGRVLLLLGDRKADARDIEMSVTTLCQTDKRSGEKRVCGEEVTLRAQGKFVVELPSVAVPLLVSDLSTFLYWRDELSLSDGVLTKLLSATDRLLVDSLKFDQPRGELIEIHQLLQQETYEELRVSDLNWERLTLWRALLADFYDVPGYQPWLDRIDAVRVDFVAPEPDGSAVAAQALLIAGWLASRLGWSVVSGRSNESSNDLSFEFTSKQTPTIKLDLKPASRESGKPGRLVHVELRSSHKPPASFIVTRSDDDTHILAEAQLGSQVTRGRLLPARNRSTAQLIAREMEILSHDLVYRQALAMVDEMLKQLS